MSLGSAAVMTFGATADAVRARDFYETTLGLTFVEDGPFALVFDLNGTMLRIQKVEALTPAPYTSLGWQVGDIAAQVRDLSSRGVAFERYDWMSQDELDIWTTPEGSKIAWFKDPDSNLLSLTQFA
jgi:catechol 2,3-dioxygenase-like lactoylglutathione lyase family enzyme